jgi:hypothetical protein
MTPPQSKTQIHIKLTPKILQQFYKRNAKENKLGVLRHSYDYLCYYFSQYVSTY